jgi:hypothetical protein
MNVRKKFGRRLKLLINLRYGARKGTKGLKRDKMRNFVVSSCSSLKSRIKDWATVGRFPVGKLVFFSTITSVTILGLNRLLF